MTEFILFVMFIGLSYLTGSLQASANMQDRCVAKYADMPHNKVQDYCKTILKFEKDPK